MVMDVRLRQEEKQLSGIFVIELGMVTEVITLPEKALSSKLSTVYIVPLTVMVEGMTIEPE